MSVDEMHKQFPGMDVKDKTLPVLFDPEGGFLDSDNAVNIHVSLAKVLEEKAAGIPCCMSGGCSARRR